MIRVCVFLSAGDQVLEWNGVSLLNKSYEEVQEVLDNSNGEVELLLRCDYNVRDLEAGLEEARLARRASHQAEKGTTPKRLFSKHNILLEKFIFSTSLF